MRVKIIDAAIIYHDFQAVLGSYKLQVDKQTPRLFIVMFNFLTAIINRESITCVTCDRAEF